MHRLLLVLLLIGLAACSAKTRYTLSVDLASFLPAGQRAGTLNLITSGSVIFPDSSSSVPLPSLNLKAIEKASVELALVVSNNSGTTSFSYELYIAPASDTNVGDGQGGEFKVGSEVVNLAAGEQNRSIVTNVALSQTQNGGAYTLIAQGGSIKYAIKLTSTTALNLDYELTTAKLGITVRPLGFLQ